MGLVEDYYPGTLGGSRERRDGIGVRVWNRDDPHLDWCVAPAASDFAIRGDG